LEKANPYKIAKEKGISVDEAKAQIEQAREKNQKKLDKLGPGFTDLLKTPEESEAQQAAIDTKKNKHKVSGPRPIAAAGGTFKSGKKAEAEKRAAEAAKKAAAKARAKNNNKKSGKKK
jgi:hypothetical protein